MKFSKFLLYLYKIAPIWLQNILISVYGLYTRYVLYGSKYNNYLKQFAQQNFKDIESLEKYQLKEFKKLLVYAVNNSQFYRKFYQNVNLDSLQNIEDINKLPILSKELLRKNIKDIYTVPERGNFIAKTGGTTGKPLTVVFLKEDAYKRNAFLDNFKSQHGFINLKMKTARFMGRDIIPANQKKKVFWRNNYPLKIRYYSSFYITKENLKYYVDDLNKYKPQGIDGFISSIYEVAKYIKDNKIQLSFKPIAIFPTAETVLPIHRKIINEVFSCPILNQYASNEGAPFITECKSGHLHENITTGVFEHIKTNDGIKLLVTSFNTYGTPLIRYDIGDYIVESKNSHLNSECLEPIISSIEGRSHEFLFAQDMRKINTTALSSLMQDFPNSILNAQFIQDSFQEIHIKLAIDKNAFNEKNTIQIEKSMQNLFGNEMKLRIDLVEIIEREKSGKYLLIKNGLATH